MVKLSDAIKVWQILRSFPGLPVIGRRGRIWVVGAWQCVAVLHMAPKKRWTPQAAAVAGFSIHNFFKPPPAAPTFFAFTAFLYSQAWSSQGQLIYRPGLNLSRVLIWYSLLPKVREGH